MASNPDTVRGVYDVFAKGDVAAVLAAMDDNIDGAGTGVVAVREPDRTTGRGREHLWPVVSQIDGSTVTANEIVDGGDTVCSIGVYSGTGQRQGPS